MIIHPSVLTIAGSDSSGGAGIQADIKTISATGSYAASVITAVTAQNTVGVQAIQAITPDIIQLQLEAVFSDLNIVAVKIGMLFDEEIIDTVSDALKKFQPKFIVLDPVCISKSGCELIKPNALLALTTLFKHVNLVTPNLSEAEKLTSQKITNQEAMTQAAIHLSRQYQTNFLVKGGHLESDLAADFLATINGTTQWFENSRVDSKNTHGTGCTLSSAIASYVAQGHALTDAIAKAKHYLTHALQSAQHQNLGHGSGPVDHFYFLQRCQTPCLTP